MEKLPCQATYLCCHWINFFRLLWEKPRAGRKQFEDKPKVHKMAKDNKKDSIIILTDQALDYLLDLAVVQEYMTNYMLT